LHPQETVIDHTKGTARNITSNSGNQTSVVVNNYTGGEVQQRRQRGPDGDEVVIDIVRRGEGRGAFDKTRKARFGQTPQAVKP